MKKTKRELLSLASDTRKAAWLEFYEGHNDHAPDGTRLTGQGKLLIAEALEFQANNDKSLEDDT